MKTIVSLTPVRVEADSRTFKQAASIARFGYRSIVVEGEHSEVDRAGLPFELRSMAARPLGKSTGSNSPEAHGHGSVPRKARGLVYRFRQRLKSSPFGPPLLFAGYLADYWRRYVWLPVRSIPAASLYHLHSPLQFPAVYLLCKRYRARFVYDAHDFYSGMTDAGELTIPLDRWMQTFLLNVESLCVKKASATITVNDGIAALQREAFGCSPIVLRNSHDDRLDRKPCLGLREALGLSPETFLLVTVGQAKPGQAIREALTALRELPTSVHLALLGRNYEQYQDLIRELGIAGRVHLVPPVKPYEVVPFIQSADASLILYYPRTAQYLNCLPNGFFQSVAAELPLLYPELPEIEKLAKQYQLGISIDPREPGSIRTAVLELLENPEQIQAYRRNLQRARQELSWEREEGVLRDLLGTILK
jgi:glycosyltransferase involved in cell wall biosynthesis